MAKETTGIGVQMANAPVAVKTRSTVASLFKLVTFKRVTKAKEYDDSDGNKVRRIAQALIRLGDTGVHFTANVVMLVSSTGAAGVKVTLPSIPAGSFFMPVFKTDDGDSVTEEQLDDWKVQIASEYVKWDEQQSRTGQVQATYQGKNLVVALPRHVPASDRQ